VSDLPNLSLDDAAEIEHARDAVFSTRHIAYPLLFGSPYARLADLMDGAGRQRNPMPAAIKVELRNYAHELLDGESKVYLRYAGTIPELRSWLDVIASRIITEVTNETKKRADQHDFHCPIKDRVLVVGNELRARIEYWCKAAETSPAAIRARAKATNAQIKATMARAQEVLASLEITEIPVVLERAKQQSRSAESDDPSMFPKRASWVKERLRERGWDHNDPHRFSGPDRKTMLKILEGMAVKEDTLDKLVTSLNRKKLDGLTITLLQVPTD
jgi:hypothetical protein